jgi:hypothetical protein
VTHLRFSLAAVVIAAAAACSSPAPAQNEDDQEALRAFWSQPVNQGRLEDYVRANVQFTLLHETAHYLFHVLQVPVAGREEDAADRFAVSQMIPRTAGGPVEAELTSSPEAAELVWVAYSFINSGRLAPEQQRTRLPWYDEHSVDEQRGYDVLCLLYGSNPERFKLTAHDPEIGIPDENRLARCPLESARND